MGTLSFHAGTEGKMSKKNMKGLLNHTLRKTLEKYKSHKNDKIDMTLTKNNIDWTKGNRPVDESVDEMIEMKYKGKKKLRSDAVVLREIIVQPSPDVFAGLSESEKQQKAIQFTDDSMKWFADEFGRENLMAASLHMDETNPHAHIMIMPMTEDGRLSQKDFFRGPAGLKRQHREYREHMNNLGWDFDLENKYENVDGVTLPHYKANAQEIEAKRIEQKKMLEELKADPDVRQDAQKAVYSDIYENVLGSERLALKQLEDSLNERETLFEEVLDKFEAKVSEEQEKLSKREHDLAIGEAALVAEKKEEREWQRRVQENQSETASKLSIDTEELAEKEKRLKKQEIGLNAVALALFQGDPKYKTWIERIETKGVSSIPPDRFANAMADRISRAQRGLTSPMGDKKYINQQIARQEAEDDGPDL